MCRPQRAWRCFHRCCWYKSCWWSLGLSFGLQHLHSTFSKGHSTGFQKQSLRILHCVGAQRASSTFTLWLLRTWHLLCKEFDALHCTHTIKWSTTKGRMTYQLVQTLEPEVPEHQEQHQHHSTYSKLQGHKNSASFDLCPYISPICVIQ